MDLDCNGEFHESLLESHPSEQSQQEQNTSMIRGNGASEDANEDIDCCTMDITKSKSKLPTQYHETCPYDRYQWRTMATQPLP